MKRTSRSLSDREFDLVIAGGGIYGVALAREAALNGLSVAVMDKGDFCAEASANSLKIIHGGLRYLQQADLPRFVESVRERRFFLRAAPHLVEVISCAMPTRGHLMKSRAVMSCGLLLNDLLSWNRNVGVPGTNRMGRGSVVSRADWLRIAPDLDDPRFTGAARWFDGMAYSTERLALALLESAVEAGAEAANYAEVTGFEAAGHAIAGVRVRDRLAGGEFTVRARHTIACGGAWVRELLGTSPRPLSCPAYQPALAMNVILKRQLVADTALGLMCGAGRLLFLVPWRGRTLAGTYYRLHEGPCDEMRVTGRDVDAFLRDLNSAYPSARLGRDDVAMVHAGLLPCSGLDAKGEPAILRHYRVVDHARADAVPGLTTILGVKYTTARDVAARVLAPIAARLGKSRLISTDRFSLPGGEKQDCGALVAELRGAGIPGESARELARHHGARAGQVASLGLENPAWRECLGPATTVIGAEVVHAARNERVGRLSDVVLRRTALGAAGRPDAASLGACAALVAAEMGWDAARADRELNAVRATPLWGPFPD
jgi:glycerol-3-phosphate dehydrogenase